VQPAFPYRLKGQQCWLSPDRCIYWEEESCLIVSDLHLGKTGHFRKSGIAVPSSVYREDLQRLLALVQYFRPRLLVVVGDLCHSRENKELGLFLKWRNDLPDLAIRLIKGNHDILKDDWYEQAGIAVSPHVWQKGPFVFIHDIADMPGKVSVSDAGATHVATEQTQEAGYIFSGHIHPGVRINGLGRQSLQFPCFYFGVDYAVLPAFSRFTGMVSIDAASEDNIFAIVPPEPRRAVHAGGGKGRQGGAGSILQIQ